MPINAAKAMSTLPPLSDTERGKVTIVVGGTQGIGAAIVKGLTKLDCCARLIIVGRSESKAQAIIESVSPSSTKVEFVMGDLSTVKGIRKAFTAVQVALKGDQVDYLVQCQNGPLFGEVRLNSEGDDTSFVIQVLSRIFLSYRLTEYKLLRNGARVVNIANTGLTYNSLECDDLSLIRVAEKRSKIMLCVDQSKRDSTVLDSMIVELNERYPHIKYYHINPGLVSTEGAAVQPFPFLMRWAYWFGLWAVGTTPEQYANIPLFILVHPDAPNQLGDQKYFDEKLNPTQVGVWASSKENREKLWYELIKRLEL